MQHITAADEKTWHLCHKNRVSISWPLTCVTQQRMNSEWGEENARSMSCQNTIWNEFGQLRFFFVCGIEYAIQGTESDTRVLTVYAPCYVDYVLSPYTYEVRILLPLSQNVKSSTSSDTRTHFRHVVIANNKTVIRNHRQTADTHAHTFIFIL